VSLRAIQGLLPNSYESVRKDGFDGATNYENSGSVGGLVHVIPRASSLLEGVKAEGEPQWGDYGHGPGSLRFFPFSVRK
jgi:hypothetical protein